MEKRSVQGAMVREKHVEDESFFQVREYCGWSGNLKKMSKDRDFENECFLEICLFCSRGKYVLSREICKHVFLLIGGYS